MRVSFVLQLLLFGPELLFYVCAQTDGDIRLVDGNQRNYGRVEVYFEGKWGTICDVNYNGAASAICHQLNHTSNSAAYPATSVQLMNEAFSTKSGHHIESNVTSPIILRDIDCGAIYSDPSATLHILRCEYAKVGDPTECSHDNDLAVYCDDLLRYNPYDSEVRLVGGEFSSEGTLEIFHGERWGNICHEGFNKTAADTACRQMGFTHAINFMLTEQNTTDTVWLAGRISCGPTDVCLSECVSVNSFNETSCDNGGYVKVMCGFDAKKQNESGNAIRCSLRRKFSKTPAYFFAIMSVSSGLWLVSVAVIITTAVCYSTEVCPLYKHKLRRKTQRADFTYYSINK